MVTKTTCAHHTFAPMQSAKNLRVYAHALELATLTDRVTATFPGEERYGLIAQMRRAAVSIGSNIAEGCGRLGDRELAGFLRIALGSASELEFQCELSAELAHGSAAELEALTQQIASMKR